MAPYTCDFEKYGDCHLEQDHIDDFDWSIWDYGHNGGNIAKFRFLTPSHPDEAERISMIWSQGSCLL